MAGCYKLGNREKKKKKMSIVLRKNEEGQVLLLLLLVMGVSLMIGLSISSRSINALKQSGSSTESLLCLNQAEGGIEDALQSLSDPAELTHVKLCDPANLADGSWDDASGAPDTLDENMVVCDLDGSICGDRTNFTNPIYDVAYCIFQAQGEVVVSDLNRDDTYQILLREGASSLQSIDLHWSGGSAVPYFSLVGSTNTPASQKLDVGAFDPATGDDCDLEGDNDPTHSEISSRVAGGKVINIRVPTPDPSYPSERLDLRLKFLCGDVSEMIIVGRDCYSDDGTHCDGNDVPLPSYAYTIRSTCINQPVSREIEAVKWPPTLPAIFDLGVYSGSSDDPLGE